MAFLKNQGFKWLSEDGKWSKQDKNGKNMSKYQRLHIDRFNVNCQKNYKIYIK